MTDTSNKIKHLINDVLQIGQRANEFSNETPLIGALPELDSMAVFGMITALEEEFNFTVHDDEISIETFNTLGSLIEFVDNKLMSTEHHNG